MFSLILSIKRITEKIGKGPQVALGPPVVTPVLAGLYSAIASWN